MKNLIISSLLTVFSLSGFSQDKKTGLTIQLSNPIRDTQVSWFDIDNESFDNHNVKDKSFAVGLLASYKIKTSNIRLRLNYTKINIEEYHDLYQSGENEYTSVKGRQNKLTISPGLTWVLNRNKLDLYFGFELPLTLHGEFTLKSETIESDSISGSINSEYYKTARIPSGYSVGIGGIAGFNYFLHPNFSVGAEFSPSLLYAKLGGQTSSTYSYTNSSNTNSNTTTTEDAMEGVTFFEYRFSIGLSTWF